jgi:RND family efflux transporter MFP subunit
MIPSPDNRCNAHKPGLSHSLPYTCAVLLLVCLGVSLSACAQHENATAAPAPPIVGTALVSVKPIAQHLTISSELVPFQQIDVYAKQAGYVKKLFVDYGTHVRDGQLMAVLEIPELEALLQQDEAAIHVQNDQINRAGHEVNRVKAQHQVLHLQYQRIAGVAKTKPGLVAQQEVDDAQGKDLAAESQLEASEGALEAAQSQLVEAKAKLTHDQALYAYSRITAPFDGIVTKRYANLGALMQAGTTSTQATPLVQLSQEDLFRLVIPVPESYVKYIRIGDPVAVRVPSLNKDFDGKVIRFSGDVTSDTRTMHTEVDVPNKQNLLVPGMYAEALLTLGQNATALTVPLQAVSREGNLANVLAVDDNDQIENRQISLGMQTPDYVQVTSGLKAGEQVVVSERGGLRPGETVKPKRVEAMAYQSATPDQE